MCYSCCASCIILHVIIYIHQMICGMCCMRCMLPPFCATRWTTPTFTARLKCHRTPGWMQCDALTLRRSLHCLHWEERRREEQHGRAKQTESFPSRNRLCQASKHWEHRGRLTPTAGQRLCIGRKTPANFGFQLFSALAEKRPVEEGVAARRSSTTLAS